ncbi:hypothetical protein SOD_p00180 (plasmid) [Serratia plymuthica 4Rx13]|uniref:Large polyvalent protein associated domain-containing protein n=1 Tax=Serratia plymuthica TaxID=82996 RepID=A0A318PAQ1_SERPL|nr:LPD29 domain-containing protein [Serratia plymuthica]AGO57692.1 hypothetical protein SOD_p00180 [Serratia plymuthica 4Rx13]PYD36577.1 hypothetical protein CT690_23825 [Serratia plymuthica]
MKTQTKKFVVVGQIVSTELYGLGRGVVCSINGEQSQYGQDKNVSGVIHRGGGNAKFDIAFFNGERTKSLPECILRSVQWSIHDEVATPEAVKMACEYTEVVAAQKAKEEQLERDIFLQEKEKVRNSPEYELLQSDDLGAKGVAINIRKELKAAFPKVKFSVRKSDYDCVSIKWTDGPTEKQVRDITDKYKYGRFDAMQDMYVDNSSPFNEVFGGTKYVMPQREISDELIKKAIDEALKKFGSEIITNECTVESYRNGMLNNFRDDYFERGLSYEINRIAHGLGI